MIPSDHYVRFYNEVFKFIAERGDLNDYFNEISRKQEMHCLELFRTKGTKGMYEYWERIRIEENCDLEADFGDNWYTARMKKCPSLSKVVDNDAGPYTGYCLHCPGWILPLIRKAGFFCVYDVMALDMPQCAIYVFKLRADAEAKLAEILASGRDPQLVKTNI